MTNEHVDAVLLSDLKEVMDSGFNQLITVYLDDFSLRFEALQQSLIDRNFEVLRKTAHALKGSSSNMGASILAELLQKIEDMAKEGFLKDETLLLHNIRDEYQSVRVELLQWTQSE